MATKREQAQAPTRVAEVRKVIQQWPDEKLDFELTFAEAGVVETWAETIAWRDALRAEAERRQQAA
jgi:hypothetical protein